MRYKPNRQYRLPDYDYSQAGLYFVTVCCISRAPFFGEIRDGSVRLSEIGEMTRQFWLEIPTRFAGARFDEFVIMPHHIHGLVVLSGAHNDVGDSRQREESAGRHLIYQMRPAEKPCVGKRLINQTPTNTKRIIKNNPMVADEISLGRIIRWFKGRASYEIHRKGWHDFRWQRRFYDHVIRNEADLAKIRNYIRQNPARWERDRDYPENLFPSNQEES